MFGAGVTVTVCQWALGIEFVLATGRFRAMGRPVAVTGREKAGWQIVSSKAVTAAKASWFEVLPGIGGMLIGIVA